MSHGPKVVSLAAALLLFAGGVSLAGPPDPPKPTTPYAPTPIQPPGAARFWFSQPTQNEQIPAKTKFDVKLNATYPPPPHAYLEWEWKVSGNWQKLDGLPTGKGWGGTSLELTIPVPEVLVTGYYRVRATSDWKASTFWRHFQIIEVRKTPVPVPLPKLYPKPKIGPPPVEQQNVPQR